MSYKERITIIFVIINNKLSNNIILILLLNIHILF
jgi:hypothetical protein